MENSCRKCAPKASPRPLFNFGKKIQSSYCLREILLKIRCFEEDYQKVLKNLTLFFSFEPSPF